MRDMAHHLAFEHFETINMPLDGARTPAQGHAGFHCSVVLIQPSGKTLQGLQRTGGRALQPGIKMLRLPLAHKGQKVLREVNRLGYFGMLCTQLAQLLDFRLGTLRLASEDKPGRPAWRERDPWH
jgi:hypothetical protein